MKADCIHHPRPGTSRGLAGARRAYCRLPAALIVLAVLAAWPAATPGQAVVLDAATAVGSATSAPPPGTAVRRGEGGVLTLTVRQPPPQPWQAQVVFRSTGDVRAGDVVLLSFRLRSVTADPQTGESAIQWFAQRAEPPWKGGDEAVVVAPRQWLRHEVPLRIREDMPAGKLQFALNFGLCRQEVEVSDVSAVNLGPRDAIAGLRNPPATYAGREPDAPWRAAAAERIEKLRKGDLRISVTDADGKPVAGATVRARLAKHAFAFGSAVVADRLLGESADDQEYREVFLRHFNTATFEYEMKWPYWERGDPPTRRRHRERVLAAVRWLNEHGVAVRGHAMVWPGWGEGKSFVPADVMGYAVVGDAASVERRVALHIADVGRAFAGQLVEWDVVNEPLHNRRLQDVLGDGAVIDWFRQARRADPSARLYLNEFAMLSYGALDGEKLDRHYEMLRRLLASGAPVGGLGEQAHFREVLVGPGRMVAILDRFALLGLPIRITEFDVAAEDEQLQADYTRDFLTAAFSHPAVNGVVLWGFWQGQHAAPKAALWRKDWSIKPNGQALSDLLLREWTTDATATTEARGQATIRGFRGDYEITVEAGGKSKVVRATLGDETTSVPVRVE